MPRLCATGADASQSGVSMSPMTIGTPAEAKFRIAVTEPAGVGGLVRDLQGELLAAVNAAGGVDLVDGYLGAAPGVHGGLGYRAGQRADEADA